MSEEANSKLADNQETGGMTEILWTWKLYRVCKGPESQASACMKDSEEPQCSIVTLLYQTMCSMLTVSPTEESIWAFHKLCAKHFSIFTTSFSHSFLLQVTACLDLDIYYFCAWMSSISSQKMQFRNSTVTFHKPYMFLCVLHAVWSPDK